MQETMTRAEHIVAWAECSAPHARRLKALVPGASQTPREHAYKAFLLAADTSKAMICAGDLSRMDLEPGDILTAALLMLESQKVPT